jgi:vitamin K-dependent gamma-carboxylase
VALPGFIGLWLAFQILVPVRHLLYPGQQSWTEQGHRFSWQMKLRDKQARAMFFVRDPASGREWRVRPNRYLARHQAREMPARPDMVLQFAHYLARVWAEQRGIQGVEVRARVCASLNGRKAALMVDPQRDLARVERNLRHADWILPLEEPFERPEPRRGRVELSC